MILYHIANTRMHFQCKRLQQYKITPSKTKASAWPSPLPTLDQFPYPFQPLSGTQAYTYAYVSVVIVQSLSCIGELQAYLSFTVSWNLRKLMSTESVMSSNNLILFHPLLLPSIFPSIRVFSNESLLHIRWPKYWSFSFSISPLVNI